MPITLFDLAGADDAHRFSPHCWRTRMALAHKGLEVTTVPWRFTEKDAIAKTGQGTTPVIVDGDRWVHDSWEIALYLDETYKDRPALFEGAQSKAHAQFIRRWCDRIVHPGIIKLILVDIYEGLHEKDKAYFRESREKRFGKKLEDVVADPETFLPQFRQSLTPLGVTLADQPFLGGEQPSFADYIVFGAFQWARTCSPIELVEADDPIAAWRGRLLDLFDGLAGKALCRTA